ncbi:uncharacterized protein Gasu_62210, partial [Galdieria sulphuraria]
DADDSIENQIEAAANTRRIFPEVLPDDPAEQCSTVKDAIQQTAEMLANLAAVSLAQARCFGLSEKILKETSEIQSKFEQIEKNEDPANIETVSRDMDQLVVAFANTITILATFASKEGDETLSQNLLRIREILYEDSYDDERDYLDKLEDYRALTILRAFHSTFHPAQRVQIIIRGLNEVELKNLYLRVIGALTDADVPRTPR